MTKTLVLVCLLSLTIPVVSQEVGEPQAQCKFSDGNTIKVTHLSGRNTYELATDEDLLTKGMSVPAGDYIVLPATDPHNGGWTLKMLGESARVEPRELPPVPMSMISRVDCKRPESTVSPVVSFTVSFEQRGGSCMMHWHSDKPNVVLSLEFTEMNTGLSAR